MSTYSIIPSQIRVSGNDALHLALSFGEAASNDVIVREVDARMRDLKRNEIAGGHLVLLEGPASLPVISVIAHHVAHLFGAVAVYDPKLAAYIIAISHDPAFPVGEMLCVNNQAAESKR
jgi:CRISPR-associated protein Csx3